MNTPVEPEQTLHQALASFKTLSSPQAEAKPPISDEEFAPACQFVTQLAVQAHQYGASMIRLQDLMSQLPQLFGFYGVMLSAVPFMFFEYWRKGDLQPSRVTVRQSPTSFDIAKLSKVGVLVNDLADNKVQIADGIARLEEIDALPPPYKDRVVAVGYMLCGAGFAVLLSAGWRDALFAALLSLVVFVITRAAGRSQWLASRLSFTAALAASILANVLALLFPGSDASVVALCAIVVLVPGLALTLGVAELASNLVIPGASRLVDGIMVTFALVAGAAIGTTIVGALWNVPEPDLTPATPLIIVLPAVLLLMFGLSLVFQVLPSDIGWVVLAGLLAYIGVIIGDQLGDWQGPFLGAMVLGIFTSLYSRGLHRPASAVMLPGILILVPGVAAYFSLNALQSTNILEGLPAVWGVLVQIVAIIAGLFVAASVFPQRSSL